ncbi:MAG TPA: Lrp/AsnC family transcriptional regulator [Phenylobacterium sp.]|uniref:Lrp/AsnC family transcriptional regulator n=1 Tax=Phenylobacterium sp. TaxID=1871053 RepID=UPI002B468BA4|nr:Lrp/AsnC family transcriptional regulator [Phenylobacterium sp.]HKR89206.1 Lrp/AsnC family transcriptional regulator [Phenylobacterium sp.]HKT53563.1 Lrp/AsnC family transcriptional regulator [Caulobacteraceae bacterium]
MPLDAIDQKLIAALRRNGRASTAQLARLVGRSRTTVQARIERLERDGVIIGYAARLAPEREQGAVRAHVMVKVEPKKEAAVGAALRGMDEVRVLHTVAGVFDMIVVAAADTVGQIEGVIDRIGNLEGVERTTSSIILSTKLDR